MPVVRYLQGDYVTRHHSKLGTNSTREWLLLFLSCSFFLNNERTENQRGWDWLQITRVFSAEPEFKGWPVPFPALISGLFPWIHYGLGIAAKIIHLAQVISLSEASLCRPGAERMGYLGLHSLEQTHRWTMVPRSQQGVGILAIQCFMTGSMSSLSRFH